MARPKELRYDQVLEEEEDRREEAERMRRGLPQAEPQMLIFPQGQKVPPEADMDMEEAWREYREEKSAASEDLTSELKIDLPLCD